METRSPFRPPSNESIHRVLSFGQFPRRPGQTLEYLGLETSYIALPERKQKQDK